MPSPGTTVQLLWQRLSGPHLPLVQNTLTTTGILLLALLASFWIVRNTDQNMRKDFLRQSSLAAMALDREAIADFRGDSSDIYLEEYNLVRRQLTAIRSANPDCVYIYLLRKADPGIVIFLLDIGHTDNPEESSAQPGEIYDDMPGELLQVFRTRKPATLGPYTDKWGTFFSSVFPISDPDTNEVIAVLGMDIDASKWRIKRARQAALPVSLLFFVIILLGLSVRMRHRTLSERRSRMQKAAIANLALDKVIRSSDFEQSLKEITRLLAQSLKVNRASIWKFSHDKNTLNCLVLYNHSINLWDTPSMAIETGNLSHYIQALEAGRRIIVSDVQRNKITRELFSSYYKPNNITSVMEAGIYNSGELIGVTCIEVCETKRKWFTDEEGFLATCSALISQIFADQEKQFAEEALMLSEKKYRLFFDQVTLGIIHFEPTGKITDCNTAFARMAAMRREEILSKNISDFTDDRIAHILTHALEGLNENFTGDCRFFGSSENLPVRIICSHISSLDGTIQGGVAVWEDRSMLKEKEELERKVMVASESARFKQNFLANMSHELRTPLTGILGMIEVIRLTQLDSIQKEYLSILHSSGENLKEIINQVLDFSKIEAGKTDLKLREFRVSRLIERARKLYEPGCNAKGITFNSKCDEEIPQCLIGDSQRISQVINNLVSNAVKFTQQGSISLAAWCEAEKLAPGRIRIFFEVKDTGKGIAPEKQKLLFIPFSQTHENDIREYDGTGLGLSICKELVILMGGEIGFESNPDAGSRFWFSIPVSLPQAKKALPNDTNLTNQPRSLRILLVEDKPINQKVIKLILASHGHKVTIAGSGEEALQQYSQGKFDLILMDIQMPHMDGIETTRLLRTNHENLPPIVGLSANAFEGDKEKYITLGLDAYLTKPLEYKDFALLIQTLPFKGPDPDPMPSTLL